MILWHIVFRCLIKITKVKRIARELGQSTYYLWFFYFTSQRIKKYLFVKITLVSTQNYVFNFLKGEKKDENKLSFWNEKYSHKRKYGLNVKYVATYRWESGSVNSKIQYRSLGAVVFFIYIFFLEKKKNSYKKNFHPQRPTMSTAGSGLPLSPVGWNTIDLCYVSFFIWIFSCLSCHCVHLVLWS